MGVPKKKKTTTKIGSRQSHQRLPSPTLVECSHCHKLMAPHRVCPHCGYYEDRHEVEIKVKEHKKKIRGR